MKIAEDLYNLFEGLPCFVIMVMMVVMTTALRAFGSC
jgi:hypothetical protein